MSRKPIASYTIGSMPAEIPPSGRFNAGKPSPYRGLYNDLKAKVYGLTNGAAWPTYFDSAEAALRVRAALTKLAAADRNEDIKFVVRGRTVYASRNHK